MRVNYRSNDGRIGVEVEGNTQSAVFEEIARFQEVFESNTCGKCKSANVQFVVRSALDPKTKKNNKYYEYRCNGCRAKLALGMHLEGGGLFPKRKDGDEWLPDSGWVRWNPETKSNE